MAAIRLFATDLNNSEISRRLFTEVTPSNTESSGANKNRPAGRSPFAMC